MRIFPSCTILGKEQECNAPLHPSSHPLKVFVQDLLPLGKFICGTKRQGDCTQELSLFEYLWFILDLPIVLNSQKVTHGLCHSLRFSYPWENPLDQVTEKSLPDSLH